MEQINTISTSYEKGKQWFIDRIASGKLPSCSPGYVSGSCQGGHRFAYFQFCGKEFCANCSRDGSPIHQRRVNNWWKIIDTWPEMGYLVITIPDFMRPYFFDKDVLKDFRSKLLRKLRKDYKISEGLCRWHWFGDCEMCGGKGCLNCSETGSGDYWHPHLNILFKGSYIADVQEWLQPIKAWMRLYFCRLIDRKIDRLKQLVNFWDDEIETELNFYLDQRNQVKNLNLVLNYSYVKDDALKMNRLKYITRSTFRRFNYDVKRLLYNLRNSVVWGWKHSQVDDEETPDQFCPVCAEKGLKHTIKWHSLEQYEPINNLTKYENGKTGRNIYRIRNRDQNHNKFDPGNLQINHPKNYRRLSRL